MPVAPKTASHPDNQTLTLPEVAIRLGISPRHIRELARDGRLPVPCLRIGKRLVVPRRAVERFLEGESPTGRRAA
jgi:excisionase family DNA binding protein